MATIGHVRLTDGKYVGTLNTLAVKASIEIVPVGRKPSSEAPDFRVYGNGAEIGAGWIRVGKSSDKEYVSLSLDDPMLPRPLYANLGRAAGQDDDDVFALIWNRSDT